MSKKPAPTEGRSSDQTASLATSDDAACSRILWTSDPCNPRMLLGQSRQMPGVTIFMIELCEHRDDRGCMGGAFIPDEQEHTGLYGNALIPWLKWNAEMLFDDFLRAHSSNVKVHTPLPATADDETGGEG